MATSLADRLDNIDRRLKALEEHVKWFMENHVRAVAEIKVAADSADKKTTILAKCVKDLRTMIDAVGDFTDDLHMDRIRFLDAYYKVFPERADQDEKVRRQITKITSSNKKRSSGG